MIISISLTYKDINAYTPTMMYWRTKRRFKPNRKQPKPNKRLEILRRQRSAIRSKIKSRLNAITFRLGDASKLPQKRSEMLKLKAQYDNLENQIKNIQNMQKRSAAAATKAKKGVADKVKEKEKSK